MKLLLIRHGQSVGNAEGRLQGIYDSPLSDTGRRQAQRLAERLGREGWAVAAVYASDLKRAAETAEIVAGGLGAPLALDARLREHDAGVLNGLHVTEIEARYPELWHNLRHSPDWIPIPGAEGSEVFHARVGSAVDEILAQHKEDEAVAIVSHGGSLGMAMVHLLGLPIRRPAPFRFGNASLNIVEFRPRGAVLTRLNDTCHLLDGA